MNIQNFGRMKPAILTSAAPKPLEPESDSNGGGTTSAAKVPAAPKYENDAIVLSGEINKTGIKFANKKLRPNSVTQSSLTNLQNRYNIEDRARELYEKLTTLTNNDDKLNLINDFLSTYNITEVSGEQVLNIVNQATTAINVLKNIPDDNMKLLLIQGALGQFGLSGVSPEDVLKIINSDDPIGELMQHVSGIKDVLNAKKEEVVDDYINKYGLNEEQANYLKEALKNGTDINEICSHLGVNNDNSRSRWVYDGSAPQIYTAATTFSFSVASDFRVANMLTDTTKP